LSDELPNLRNVHVGATEENGELVFSHKVLTGPADQSYGINVAKLAGLPDSLIDRAADILANLEAQDVSLEATAPTRPAKLAEPVATYQASVAEPEPEVVAAEPADTQLDLFAVGPEIDPAMQAVLDEIKATNIATMTPLDAMMKLNEWQKQMK